MPRTKDEGGGLWVVGGEERRKMSRGLRLQCHWQRRRRHFAHCQVQPPEPHIPHPNQSHPTQIQQKSKKKKRTHQKPRANPRPTATIENFISFLWLLEIKLLSAHTKLTRALGFA